MSDTVVVPARPDDLDAVLGLLEQAKLPREGVAEHFQDFLVAWAGGRLVGAVGLERYGQSVLVRSLVVSPSERGRGVGQSLTERILERARAGEARRAFLLTETAADFFPLFGFVRIPRDEADPALRSSVEFATACPQTAVCMRREL